MIKLRAKNVKNVRPLIEERIKTCGLEDRVSTDYACSLVTMGTGSGLYETYVDSEENPSCILCLSFGAMTIFDEKVCLVNLLHVSEKLQKENPAKSLALGREMLQQTELQAKAHKVDAIRSSSWVWHGKGSDIGSFYESAGFEVQSHEYVKLLKGK